MARFSELVRLNYMFGLIMLSLALIIACESRVSWHMNFVSINDSHFALNKTPFLFNGFNAYWLMNVAIDPKERHKVSDVLKEASAAGLSVCRTWAFSDGGSTALQISPGVYDERTFQALDFVISEARKYRIYLILSFVNNWKDFGGKAQYVQWARNAGVQINSDDDFYTHLVLKEYYKNNIRKVVTRINTITKIPYRDDPTIMAWELMNEPRCQSDLLGTTLTGWVQEMAAFVKYLDHKHLLEIGMEGFYGDSIPNRKQFNPGSYLFGTDFISNNQIPEIDFATVHAYPLQWVPGLNFVGQVEFMQRWISSHWKDARTILKKPLVLAEFGKSSRDPGYSLSMRDVFMSAIYKTNYYLAKNGGTMAGCLVWQLMVEGMANYYDGYEIVLPQSPSTFGIISKQSHAMAALSRLIHTPNAYNSSHPQA